MNLLIGLTVSQIDTLKKDAVTMMLERRFHEILEQPNYVERIFGIHGLIPILESGGVANGDANFKVELLQFTVMVLILSYLPIVMRLCHRRGA